jgi:16S rRNA (cytosine1402-N4)-methyltransferase
MSEPPPDSDAPRRRRERYRGTHPRHFREKYKERAPERYPEAIERVLERGQTPAGQHVPILVDEVLAAVGLAQPAPRALRGVDATLGYGGHAERFLARLAPAGGTLLGLDADPRELARTVARLGAVLAAAGHANASLVTRRTNFAALGPVLHEVGLGDGVDFVFADLGVSSMQLDDPERGFSFKLDGPLDMRMNPARGLSAAEWLARIERDALAAVLRDDSDEPFAEELADVLAGDGARAHPLRTTRALADAVRAALAGRATDEETELSVRRVFQALRIEVNDEFGALERLLQQLPDCLRPGGRAVFLTFHSGEDRRVKRHFERGLATGVYSTLSDGVVRASAEERRANPRSSSAKLRWAAR